MTRRRIRARRRLGTRSVIAVIAVITVIVGVAVVTGSVGTAPLATAQSAPRQTDDETDENSTDADGPTLRPGSLTLELVDHSVDVPADGDLVLTYRITGDLAEAELLFIDQAESPPT
ncbi:MAG: hypothetical protein AAFP84_17455, partial [Actinomycetota bacterium]